MADVDKDSKTEEATSKRLRDSRKKGQVAKSADLVAAVSFLVFTMMLLSLSQYLFTNSFSYLKKTLEAGFNSPLTASNAGSVLLNGMLHYFILLLPFALIAVVLGIISNLIQVGFIYTTETLKPQFNRINPIEGFKNIFSKKSLLNLLKNIFKLVLVFYITFKNIADSGKQILSSGNLGTEKIFSFVMTFIQDLSLNIGIIMLILAIMDYVLQKRDYKKNLRMTKQEIKDEFKEMEGNPQVKSARQQKQRELSMRRMMEDVPTATVIVTNPTHIAVAIRYDNEKDKVPTVVAKGANLIAENIKKRAKEAKVPIMENKPLARAIFKKVEIGDPIPMELYKAVAEILAIVYQMEKKNKYKI